MLTIIVATLFLSLVINIVLKKFQLPTIIGYILTGTIVAYGFNLHDAVHNHELKEIAEFGVVFLMFTIGLEFSFRHLKKMRNEVFITGTLQIVITASLVYLIAVYLFGFTPQLSLILSLAIALSSTAIVLKTFNESGEINRRYGQRAMGILIMQDIAVIPILLVISFMSTDNSSISALLGEMFISAVVLLTLLWLISKYLLEPFLTQIVKTNADELFVGTILFLAIGASYLANTLGFSYSLGAFIAGMLIAETRYKHQAEADLVPFRDLLLGIFFITVGMQINFGIIFSYLHVIAMLLVAVMLLKFALIYMLVRFDESRRTSIKTALSLVQIGEFSLALLELARTNGLVGPPYGQVMIVTIVISMVITPLILKHLSSLCDLITGKEEERPEHEFVSEELREHVIILGFGEFGRNVAADLKSSGEFYIAIDNNIETFRLAQGMGEPVIFGNALKKEVLKNAAVHSAKRIIIAIDNPKKLYHICEIILSQIDDRGKIIVKVHTGAEAALISDLGIEHVIVENALASSEVGKIIHG